MSTDPRTPEAGHGIGVIVAGDSSRITSGTGPEPEPGSVAGQPPATPLPDAARRAGEAEAPRHRALASLLLAAAAGAVTVWLLQRRLRTP